MICLQQIVMRASALNRIDILSMLLDFDIIVKDG
jgi:hypothetical protein